MKESMGNYRVVVEQDKTDEPCFRKHILGFVEEEPRLIVSNCKYKRLIDYLMWKVRRERYFESTNDIYQIYFMRFFFFWHS